MLLIVPAFYLWPAIIATPVLLNWKHFKPNDTLKWFASFFGMLTVFSLGSIILMFLATLEMVAHVGAF